MDRRIEITTGGAVIEILTVHDITHRALSEIVPSADIIAGRFPGHARAWMCA